MDISMPPPFPMDEFRAFGIAASSFYGNIISDENLFDPQEKKRNFDWAWQAVRYRYRSCFETADEFKGLLTDPNNAHWLAGGTDEELVYKLEHCIYEFFTSGLSVFESLGFALYFVGGALQPGDFPDISTPRKITLSGTAKAFKAAFPATAMTNSLADLLKTPAFGTIDRIRNLLAHRVSGRRSIRGGSDGTTQWHEETWHIPGSTDTLQFGVEMLHRLLDDITDAIKPLIAAAREFAESRTPKPAQP